MVCVMKMVKKQPIVFKVVFYVSEEVYVRHTTKGFCCDDTILYMKWWRCHLYYTLPYLQNAFQASRYDIPFTGVFRLAAGNG